MRKGRIKIRIREAEEHEDPADPVPVPDTQHCLFDVLVEPPGHDLLVTERAGLHLEDLEPVLGGRVLLQLRAPSEQGDAGFSSK